MNRQQVLNCSFSSWYAKFVVHTVESEIIKLPKNFIDFLHADGIFLPPSKDEIEYGNNQQHDNSRNISSFPDLYSRIERAINQLGGAVFPKLNWSAPRDASWIACGKTLKCHSVNDILLLLKSSNFISHDLSKPFELCPENEQSTDQIQYELVLRRWMEIPPSMEFRVFIANQEVIGISQRDCSSFFPCVKAIEDDITYEINNFFERVVADTFPDDHYVLDVFRRNKDDFIIIDFNPFNEVTDSLLFSWTGLKQMRDRLEGDCEFRFIQEESGVQPSSYLAYAMPSDFTDLASGTDATKLIDFLKMEVQRQEDDDSEGSER